MTWLRHLSGAWAVAVIGLAVGAVSPAAAAPEDAADDGLVLPPGVASVLDADDADDADEVDGTAVDTSRSEGRRGARKALEPGKTKGATVVKVGWWSVVNEPPPDTGLLAAPQPPAPNVPTGALPVGAALGDPEKLAALEFALDAEPGDKVRSFRLVLRESDKPGSVLGAEQAVIVACPVTEIFWADGQNAPWKNRPVHDCDAAAAPGKRSDDGTWTFNLTSIAKAWTAPDFTGSRSVVLVEKVDAPSSFEVSFDGPKLDGVGLLLKSVPGPDDDGEGGDGGSDGGGDGSGDGGLGGGDTSGGGLGGSSGGSSDLGGDLGGGDLGSGDLGSAPGAADVPAAEEASGEEPAVEATGQPAVVPVAAPAWYSGMPRAAFLLAPVALGLAYLMMLALGPDGRPAATNRRHGVSRALDRVRQLRGTGTETA